MTVSGNCIMYTGQKEWKIESLQSHLKALLGSHHTWLGHTHFTPVQKSKMIN